MYFDTTVEYLVIEQRRDKKRRKIFQTDSEIPESIQISEFMSRFQLDICLKIVNSILILIKHL